jgi:hypothetical protein
MEALLTAFAPFGFNAMLIAVLLWIVVRLQDRISSTIDNNTKALTELKGTIEKCQLSHGGR